MLSRLLIGYERLEQHLLIFCLLVLSIIGKGVEISYYNFLDLSVSSFSSIDFCSLHFEALLLGT